MAFVTESAATKRSFLRLRLLPDCPKAILTSPPTPVKLSVVGGLLPGVVGAERDEVERGYGVERGGDLEVPDLGELFGVDLGDAWWF